MISKLVNNFERSRIM